MRDMRGRDGCEQRAGLRGIREIIVKRIGNRVRDYDLSREMHDRADAVFGNQARHEHRVGDIAEDELRAGIDIGAHAGRKIVEHDDCLAGIAERQHHMAADITGAARNQNRHRSSVVLFCSADR